MTEQKPAYGRTRAACYYCYLAMASVACLPPLLFATFRERYGVSFTLLGTLVLVNFSTQLLIDLIFTFFPQWFNLRKTVCTLPLLTSAGLFIYALVPTLFPAHAYAGLLLGTVVFSVSAGLSEVLLSPLLAALPSDNPDRDMSRLHSLYAYGVVTVIAISTVFFRLFGTKNWMYLTAFFALLPVVSSLLFWLSPFPQINLTHDPSSHGAAHRTKILAGCTACIFLGGAAENTMTNWISDFLESALRLPKSVGDVVGMALFAVLLGLGRTLYSRFGRNVSLVLLGGMAGATVCYLTIGLVPVPAIALVACVLTGLCTSMLWPGTLIYLEEKLPRPGVAAYALMAAGGDAGSALAPQLLGVVVDGVAASGWAKHLAAGWGLSPEQIGMRTGMLLAALFPLVGVVLLLCLTRRKPRKTPDA